jgi:PAS domain S-box-containing protein
MAEMEETLRAIREGDIDAIIVDGKGSPSVYTLKSASDPYRLIVEQMSESALTVSADGIILYCNAAFAQILKAPRERLLGGQLRNLIIDSSEDPLLYILAPRASARELMLRTTNGAVVHAHVSSTPLVADGQPIHCLVVTDLSRQELRVLHDAIVNSSPDAIYTLSLSGTIESWNAAAERLYGYTAKEVIGRSFQMLVPPDKESEASALLLRLETGECFNLETTRMAKSGAVMDVSISVAPLMTSESTISAVVVIARDITLRKQSDDKIRLLMDEVNHRAKNLLMVVQSMARRMSKEKGGTLFTEYFSQRLAALAASHDLLVQSNWQGVEIGDLIRRQLAHWADAIGTRIFIDGPVLRLKPAAAQALGMAFFELATNAAKYGALANDAGFINIRWSLGEDALHLVWSEHQGPPVRPPDSRGFGNTVIVNALEHSLEADVRLEFHPTGVNWALVAPANRAVD